MKKLNRSDAARLGHYKQNLRGYATVDPNEGPVRDAQLGALSWYRTASRLFISKAMDGNPMVPLFTARQVLWVAATLSPRTTFQQNLEDTKLFFRTLLPWLAALPEENYKESLEEAPVRLCAYPANVLKCIMYLRGGRLSPSEPSGPKVSCFYKALLDGVGYYPYPWGSAEDDPVVDMWIIRAATNNHKAVSVTPHRLAMIQRALTELAAEVGDSTDGSAPEIRSVHSLQALIWHNIRGKSW